MIVTANVWKESFRVNSYEIDTHGRASMPTLCRYLQEAAGNHVQLMGASAEQLMPQGKMWVLSRLNVQIQTYPLWHEQVQIETWATSRLGGIRAYRDFRFLNANDELVGAATSLWLLLDVNTRRPIRIPDYLLQFRVYERESVLPDAIERLEQPERVDLEKQFQVRLNDLDFNQHVNNVSYVEWAIETIPQSVWQNYRLAALEIGFLAESAYGDVVISQSEHVAKETQQVFKHRLICNADSRELALVKTVWFEDTK